MKRFSKVFGLLILATACVLGAATAARSADVIVFHGDTYAAIAYSPATGKMGYAYNYGSRWSAEAAALKNCKADDARIVTWVNNGFCALALGDDDSCWGVGWSYGDGATNTYARNRALQECGKRTTKPRIVLCICSANVAPEVRR
jgi:hypothetical protein